MRSLTNYLCESIQDRGLEYLNNLPNLSELADGTYKAYYYSHVLELEDGRMFYVKNGVRHTKQMTSIKNYTIKDGNIQ